MTSTTPPINLTCLQCNGTKCKKTSNGSYKNCDRYKLLKALQEDGKYNICNFSKLSIAQLAEKLVIDVKHGQHVYDGKIVNRALHIMQQWGVPC